MNKITLIFGADRCFKTTLANKLSATPLQFDCPAKGLAGWSDDYDRAWRTAMHYGSAVCARGYLEANLYRYVPLQSIIEYHEFHINNFDMEFILLEQPWSAELEKRHTVELISMGYSSDWRLDAELANRLKQHYEYYSHMHFMANQLDIQFTSITK